MTIDGDIVDPSLFSRVERVYIHEMAHVYTLTNNIASRPGPLGVAHLYFSELANSLEWEWCAADEFYADVILLVTLPGTATTYWYNCIESSDYDSRTDHATEVVRQALNGQIPDWLYETYQRADGGLDLEAVWEDVMTIKDRYVRTTVIYQLRDAFGGYCSDRYVQRAKSIGSNIRNPWKDGGCTEDTNAGATSTMSVITPDRASSLGMVDTGRPTVEVGYTSSTVHSAQGRTVAGEPASSSGKAASPK